MAAEQFFLRIHDTEPTEILVTEEGRLQLTCIINYYIASFYLVI